MMHLKNQKASKRFYGGFMALEITDENFENEVMKAKQPVLIDFWAEWCGPCKMIAPTIDELSKEYSGKVKVGKVNVDNCPGISAKYSIRSIPTLILFKEGKILEQMIGVQPKDNIKRKVEAAIS
jgi:thioredoxin 1